MPQFWKDHILLKLACVAAALFLTALLMEFNSAPGGNVTEWQWPAQVALAQPQPPYPPSPVITSLTWAPLEEIRRAASESDTFPITWGDDNLLYTAFADGFGFDPRTDEKLSLGFAFVTGEAETFAGSNIRSGQEQRGDGASGMKASGLLMVDGMLYMWMRNANNNGEECKLAWSADRARTWTFSDWNFAEFGYCTFINYGPNYAGAPDEYVYTVSPDSPSAYEPADEFVLLRAPKTQLFNREAYQYFAGTDDAGNPIWTIDIEERNSVFYHPDSALRSGISYNAGLGRYIWWQQIPDPDEDTRFEGGFGVYDAPQPWGPWTTVYFTDFWDVGPGETGSFPPRWMSPDGLTMALVFSGDDSFSVRRATLTVASQPALPDVVAEEQNQPPVQPESPLPAPADQQSGAPVDNQIGNAAGNPPAQPESPLPNPTETPIPLPPTQEPVATTVPITASGSTSPTDLLTETQPLTSVTTLTETMPVTDTLAVTNTGLVTEPMVPEAAPAAPLPVYTNQSGLLSVLFSSEALVLGMLCLIFFAVMALGFGALMVNVLYIRSRRQRGF